MPTTEHPHFATLLVMALAPEEVGRRIEQARKAKGWTHEQFLEHARDHLDAPRLNLRTVQRWQKGVDPQSGRSWLPRLGRLMALAELLEVPRSYFVESEGPAEDTAWGDVLARLDRLERSGERNAELLAELLRALRDDPDAPAAARSED